jgi:hypothetical protein
VKIADSLDDLVPSYRPERSVGIRNVLAARARFSVGSAQVVRLDVFQPSDRVADGRLIGQGEDDFG